MKVPLQAACISLFGKSGCQFIVDEGLRCDWSCLGQSFRCIFQFFYLCLKNDDLSVGSFISQNQLCAHKILLASLCMYVVVFYGKKITGFGDGKLALLGSFPY